MIEAVANGLPGAILSETPVYVDTCDVGLGVFAAASIAAGEAILRFSGRRVSRRDPMHDTPAGANLLQVGKRSYILPVAPSIYVNHSCAPNAGVSAKQTLVALRLIAAGEEIRFDYSTSMDEDFWTMSCACGTPTCRGVIGDFKRLPRPLRHRYMALGIVPRFIRRQYL
jgi:hypothetical protein